MNKDKRIFLRKKADQIRKDIVSVSVCNQAGHIAPSLSSVDILTALYYEVMNYRKAEPLWPGRDRLVFSKAHGCYGLYAILADKGFIPMSEWKNFYTGLSTLRGCVERKTEYGLEASCGSLGHGLPMAVGLAFGAMKQNKKYNTFCVVGDGELQEGSAWEALQFAVKHSVDNLTIVVDANRLQAMDILTNVLDKKDHQIINRLKGFGLFPAICPGHDVVKLAEQLKIKNTKGIPKVIVAKTIKGYGLKCMENIPKFHFRIPTQEELNMGKIYE